MSILRFRCEARGWLLAQIQTHRVQVLQQRVELACPVSVFNWFLAVFFILFMVENPRSQFAVDTGRTNVTLASIDNVFLMQDRKGQISR